MNKLFAIVFSIAFSLAAVASVKAEGGTCPEGLGHVAVTYGTGQLTVINGDNKEYVSGFQISVVHDDNLGIKHQAWPKRTLAPGEQLGLGSWVRIFTQIEGQATITATWHLDYPPGVECVQVFSGMGFRTKLPFSISKNRPVTIP